MKPRVTSENTKKMFANVLKGLLKKKKLSQISVKELVEICGVNRKTFYYHFRDIYDLMYWMLEREAEVMAAQLDPTTDYEATARAILRYIRENSYLLNCLYGSIGKQQFRTVISRDFSAPIRDLIRSGIAERHKNADDAYVRFLSDFFTKAISEILLDYLQNRESLGDETLVSYIVYTLRTAIPTLLDHIEELPAEAKA